MLAIIDLSNQTGLMKWFLEWIHHFSGEVDKYINLSTLLILYIKLFFSALSALTNDTTLTW